jgi:hypothetical protein
MALVLASASAPVSALGAVLDVALVSALGVVLGVTSVVALACLLASGLAED